MHVSKDFKFSPRLDAVGLALTLALACASLVSGTEATANTSENIAGTQRVYGDIPPDQIEHLSTGDRIKSVAASGSTRAASSPPSCSRR